ncbi:MAG: hypothetical protein MI717_00815, partial [Spirochaetales bacterium]|nr:hypothetical protein [Spirochaetales bacterium]
MKNFFYQIISVFLCEMLLFSPVITATPHSYVYSEEKVYREESSRPDSKQKILLSGPVTPDGGGRLGTGRLRICVPPGAVKKTTMITISALPTAPSLGDGRQNRTEGAVAYRFSPPGMEFLQPVSITLPYSEKLNDDEQALHNLRTMYHDPEQGFWFELERVQLDQSACTITSLTTHFTDIVNSTLSLPESPPPSLVNINSIKQIDEVRGDEGIPGINGLQPSWDGQARFSLPLRLPPGRGDSPLSLSLNYCSNGGNSEMGLGFSLGPSFLRLDTRFGVPTYDGNDPILLDGQELVFHSEQNGARVFYRRQEGDFSRIRWFNAPAGWWDVTDRNGTRRIYGMEGDWNGPCRKDGDAGSSAGAFSWALSRVEDRNGNTVDYHWEYSLDDQVLLLHSIAYSGRNGRNAFEDGTVYILFHYNLTGHVKGTKESALLGLGEEGTLLSAQRPDVRVDTRGGFPVYCSQRLDAVEVRIAPGFESLKGRVGNLLRRYRFDYFLDEFGRTLLRRYEEQDAMGEVFYGYDFRYHGLEHYEEGYVGFEKEQYWSFGSATEPLSLRTNQRTSQSATLYTGIEVFIPLLFWKKVIFSIGLRGSSGSHGSVTTAQLMDLNGDGLPDMTWNSLEGLSARLNTGRGFSSASPFILSGVNGPLFLGGGSQSSIGLSVGLGPISGGVTRQWNWNGLMHMPIDLNGDGFLDFWKAGEMDWGINQGNLGGGVGIIHWETPQNLPQAGETPSSGYSTEELEDFQRTYYTEEPLRKWRAWRGGEVEMSNHVQSAQNSYFADVHYPHEGKYESFRLTSTSPKDHRSVSITQGDSLYFRLGAEDCAEGESVHWNTKIQYQSIQLFENMKNVGTLLPPETLPTSQIAQFSSLLALYQPVESSDPNGPPPFYSLHPNWRHFLTKEHEQSLVHHGFWVPSLLQRKDYLDYANFVRLYSEEHSVGMAQQVDFALSWFYEASSGTYKRHGENDSELMQLWLQSLSAEQNQQLAQCFFPHGESYPLRIPSQPFSFTTSPPKINMVPKILGENDVQNLGETNASGLILLEQIDGSESLHSDSQIYWDNRNQRIIEKFNDQQRELPFQKVVDESGLVLHVQRGGLEHRYELRAFSSVLEQIPKTLFDSIVQPSLLEWTEISSQGISQLTGDEWNALIQLLDDSDDQEIFKSLYLQNPNGVYEFTGFDGLTLQEWSILRDTWQAVPLAPQSRLFRQLPGGKYPERAVLWRVAEAIEYHQFFGTSIPDLVPKMVHGEVLYLPLDAGNLLYHNSLKDFRVHSELFPYYSQIDDAYHLKSDANAVEVSRVMENCGFFVPSILNRSLVYQWDSLLPVVEGFLQEGHEIPLITPEMESRRRPLAYGDEIGLASYVYYNSNGTLTYYDAVIPTFDNENDYSIIDITLRKDDELLHLEIPEEYSLSESQQIQLQSIPQENLPGGVLGWYYGQWNGYYEDFNPEFVQESPNYDNYSPYDESLRTSSELNVTQRSTPPPPYCIGMVPNATDPEEPENPSPQIIEVGSFEQSLSPYAWIGSISEDSQTGYDSDGFPYSKTLRYASYIDGSLHHVNRRGGGQYRRIPDLKSTKSFDLLDAGVVKTTDINGGLSIPPFGANLGRNWGYSLRYAGMTDINGDAYPDFLRLPIHGGGECQLFLGSPLGFLDSRNLNLPGIGLSQSILDGYTLGASIGSSCGGASYEMRGSKVAGFLAEPSENSSISSGISFAMSQNHCTRNLQDINGDGLTDYLKRIGTEPIQVYLNEGGTFSTEAISWDIPGGWREQILPLFGRTNGLSQGLSTGNTATLSMTQSLGYSAFLGPISLTMGGGFGLSGTVDRTAFRMMDFTGDGLPDLVIKRHEDEYFLVRVNLGTRFSTKSLRLYRPTWSTEWSSQFESDLNRDLAVLRSRIGTPSIGNKPIFLPDSKPVSFSQSEHSHIANPARIEDVLEYSSGVSVQLNGYLGFSFNFFLVCLTIQPGLRGSLATTTASLMTQDITGDGLPDHILQYPGEDGLRVKPNISHAHGLLSQIRIPQGGRISLEYEFSLPTVDSPHGKWVWSGLEKASNTLGLPKISVESLIQQMQYSGARYDRIQRRFLGFAKVVIEKRDDQGHVLTRQVNQYLNHDLASRGTLSYRHNEDSQGFILSKEEWFYTWKNGVLAYGDGIRFLCLDRSQQKSYGRNTPQPQIKERVFDYDSYGQLLSLKESFPKDSALNTVLEISYTERRTNDAYIVQLPSSVKLMDHTGSILRQRAGEFDERGNLIHYAQYSNEQQKHGYWMTWDDHGNLRTLTDSRGMRLSYEYNDGAWKCYATRHHLDNSLMNEAGYSSFQSWDPGLGKIQFQRDANGSQITYRYDTHGRLVAVYSPYDESLPAISREYRIPPQTEHVDIDAPVLGCLGISLNKMNFDPKDQRMLSLVQYADGFGRPRQKAQSSRVWMDGEFQTGWNLSGLQSFNSLGQVLLTGKPEFHEGIEIPSWGNLHRPMELVYNSEGRIKQRILSDGTCTDFHYFLDDQGHQVVQTTDSLRRSQYLHTDQKGRIRRMRLENGSGQILVDNTYSYSPIGEFLSMTQGKESTPRLRISYDWTGSVQQEWSPETGLREYDYDESGNLIQRTDENLRDLGHSIAYEYDGLNRLVHIQYPTHGHAQDVHYVYGDSSSEKNTVGRLLSQTNGARTSFFSYGLLGEVTRESQEVLSLIPGRAAQGMTMVYVSDYLGRIQQLTYPDGETVVYNYDEGGRVQSLIGEREDGSQTIFLSDAGYDEDGRVVFCQMGNGTETRSEYDADRSWLVLQETRNSHGEILEKKSFQYNSVGNLIALQESHDTGSVALECLYDDHDQLKEMRKTFEYQPHGVLSWSKELLQQFDYDPDARMTHHSSLENLWPPSNENVQDQNWDYIYSQERPYQIQQIGGLHYSFDRNGNVLREASFPIKNLKSPVVLERQGAMRIANRGFGLLSHEMETSEGYERIFQWDEENRLIHVEQDSGYVHFLYDGEGNRCVKRFESGETLWFNPYWTESFHGTKNLRSKHLYWGKQRLVTRLSYDDDASYGFEDVHTFYHHPDHLGSISLSTNSQGQTHERLQYTAYGKTWIEVIGEDAPNHRTFIHHRYSGKELDEETGLYFYGARYYDPLQARWLSPDPSGFELANPMDENGQIKNNYSFQEAQNWYSYVAQNPFRYIDETGEKLVGVTVLIRQSDTRWADWFMGKFKTYDKAHEVTPNIIGAWGCKLSAAVSIGASIVANRSPGFRSPDFDGASLAMKA